MEWNKYFNFIDENKSKNAPYGIRTRDLGHIRPAL